MAGCLRKNLLELITIGCRREFLAGKNQSNNGTKNKKQKIKKISSDVALGKASVTARMV